ncbi:MAG: CocE/NonD family hydrolase [Gemmatimonadota bacterium]
MRSVGRDPSTVAPLRKWQSRSRTDTTHATSSRLTNEFMGMKVVTLLVAAGLASASLHAQRAGVPRFGVRIPMRDGIRLVANIWVPDTVGKHPTILFRTPYDKTAQFRRYKAAEYVKRGYAVVIQDTRGRGDSEGDFNFYFPEAKDGYDTIEWIAAQPWSNGRVGTDGGSYLGTVQWLAAREKPPHLACMIATAPSGRIFDEIPYEGGAFRMDWALPWLNGVAGRVDQGELAETVAWDSVFARRPLTLMDTASGRPLALYQAFLKHSTFDDYWKPIQFAPADFAKITIPTLTVTGWYDGDQPGALSYWDGLEKAAPSPSSHFLIIGPWVHAHTYMGGERKIGEIQFDSTSILPIQQIRLAFYDWCLKGTAKSFDAPRTRTFVTGINRWRTFDKYPATGTTIKAFYLHSGGSANTIDGDGRLSLEKPGAEPPDQFTYDPKKPVPAMPTARDHRAVERRSDVLVYTSEPLTDTLEVLGRVFVELEAATDGKDTDFTAKLLDVYPDGRAIALGPHAGGVRRARYRNGYLKEELLTPNQPTKFSIELFDIGHGILPGHRLRVEISSSASPFYSPNQNTGNPVATDTEWRVARQTVFHEGARMSRLLLPIPPNH